MTQSENLSKKNKRKKISSPVDEKEIAEEKQENAIVDSLDNEESLQNYDKKNNKETKKELKEKVAILSQELSQARKELAIIKKKREEEFKQLKESRGTLIDALADVKKSRLALLNILEDAEEARRQAEEERDKTKAIIFNLTDGLLLFNVENKVSLINPQIKKFFNITEKDIIGKSIDQLSSFSDLNFLVELIKEKKEIFKKEIQLKEDLVLEVTIVQAIKDEQKLGILVVFHDVSREKLIERMKTEFVSLAAHQLRTPLSAIKWTLRMVLDGDVGEITNEQKELLQKTYISNERMISLINDLLNVTRIEEGRYVLKPILINLETVIESMLKSYKEEAKRKNVEVELIKPDISLPAILVDVEKITLAIQNLLDNALHYTPAGGKIIILLNYNNGKIEFAISDTGIGIPKDQQERVFTKFFRASNAMKTDTEGSGLGLFIVKNIIEAHGGKVWFESEEGRGSTFYFNLPVNK